jgi:serine protease Do
MPWQAAQAQQAHQFRALGRGGSGVIVNRRGYVLTNHHVVHGARNITVTVFSGQVSKTYPAQLIDEAPELDFAIVKMLANGNEQFVPAQIGNSSEVFVGDEVLAVGSPFGLQQSVTFGIVSNTRRSLTVGTRTFTNFLQTDAPINPGSSGGPLVNVRGEVIGINTAIYSPTQGFSGIGFASPIDPAKAAFPEFIETGLTVAQGLRENVQNWARGQLRLAAQPQPAQEASRWWSRTGRLRQAANTENRASLGIRGRDVDENVRTSLGLPMARGVLVMEVAGNSPGQAVGLQRGDVIFRADNRSVKDQAMLDLFLTKRQPGDEMKLAIYRGGKKMNVHLKLAARPVAFWGEEWERPETRRRGAPLQGRAVALPAQPFNPENITPPGLTGALKGAEVGAGEVEALGMGVEKLAPELALAYNIPQGEKGIIIAEAAGRAQATGLLAGDLIKAINNQPVETIVDFIKVMQKADLKRGISIDVYRQGQRFQLTMKG